MKTNKLKYVWFVLILSIFCLTLFLARGRSKVEMRNRIYSQWSQQFLVTKGDQSYVRTTSDSEGTTVLSEAQSYGMLITVLAAQKGQATQADFESLYRYYQNHRIEGTQLMSWKQVIKNDSETVEKQNATDGDLYIAYSLIEAAKQWPDKAQEYQEQAKKISTKYIDPPHTTEFAMMFLPTESLYAEILRIPGLSDEIRQKYNISITSPSTLPVTLSGLLMGFRTVAIEKRSSEVWQILGAIKTQFNKFGDLLEATKKKLQESANKIDAAATTSRQIERRLKDVESLPTNESNKLIGEIDV